MSDPEIILPQRRVSALTDEALDQLASVLDDAFQIPGTRIRFGLDAIIGLVPGFGDIITGLASLVIIGAAWQRGLPRVTQLRMLANVAIETAIGAVPFVGDLFDLAWKANRKNVRLLQRARFSPSRSQTAGDWGFLIVLAICTALLISIPIVTLFLLLQYLRA